MPLKSMDIKVQIFFDSTSCLGIFVYRFDRLNVDFYVGSFCFLEVDVNIFVFIPSRTADQSEFVTSQHLLPLEIMFSSKSRFAGFYHM